MLSKGPPTKTVMCKCLPFKGTPSSNSNVLVGLLYFQRGPTTISNEQSKKSFKSTSIGYLNKLWVVISSNKFWKDPIKWEQIFIPNDNFLYQIMIFRDWSRLFGISIILWKCHSWTESIQVEQQREGKRKER